MLSTYDSTNRDSILSLNTADRGPCWLWFLAGQFGTSDTIRHVPVHCSPFSIGRRPEAHLCLPYPTISGQHAELVENCNQFTLRDLGSTNGTFVNGQRVSEPVVLQPDDLVQFANSTFRIRRQCTVDATATVSETICDHALALVQFDKMMAHRAVLPHYQPIVELSGGTTIAYEVLGRSPIFGLETPAAMFHAASQLDLEVELSRMFRWEGISTCAAINDQIHLFVNTHPVELEKAGLIESMAALREVSPRQPITLELHEAAVTDAKAVAQLRQQLSELDIQLAYDDFGAGQTRLVELVEVRPDYLKFDRNLIRDIHRASPQRISMLSTLVRMTTDLGIVPLAEGIETREESEVCRELGFTTGQGFHFGKPAPISYVT